MGATVRLWRARHNPLVRRTDVAEAWLGVGTAALMTALAPLAGATLAGNVGAQLLRDQQGWHRTTAVLTENAAYTETAVAAGDTGRAEAMVRWTAPDHSVRTAMALVPTGTRAGATTAVWTDAAGRLRHQPMTAHQAEVLGDLAGACAAAGVCLVLVGGRRVVVRVVLDRYRARAWERAWAEVEPRWTHRHA
ncbi:Rv1733c family protein [Streptantibioticus rubrisoli]|uniref:Rv1733c family protein n=1 Tax=Streptantibioticus rubrisoli TaxID=1387313 RepID=UPI003FD74493